MATGHGNSHVDSSAFFLLDDNDGFEDLLGTQFPDDNPGLPLVDLDEDLPIEITQQSGRQCQEPFSQPIKEPDIVETGRRLSRIPENVVIIDLDAPEFESQPPTVNDSSPTAFVKAEDQEVIIPSSENFATVKTEPITDFSWTNMAEEYIDLVDSDGEMEDNQPQPALVTPVKQEDDGAWIWADVERDVIELSEFEGGMAKEQPSTEGDADITTHHGALSQTMQPALNHKSMLRIPNIKSKRIPDHAKLLHMQKMCAERALGKKGVIEAEGIFKNLQGSSANGSAQNTMSSTDIVDDELAWMNNSVDPNEDADAAAKFAEIKRAYNRKKRAGCISFEDDVLFMKAESMENSRLKRLEDDYHHACGPVYSDVQEIPSEDELFVRQSPPPALKRPHNATLESDKSNNDNNVIIVESDANDSNPDAYSIRGPQSKKQKRMELEKDLQTSMMAGIEKELAKDGKKAGRKPRVPKNDRKGKPNQTKGTPRSKPKKSSIKKSKSKSKKPKPTDEGYLNNFGSLFSGNIYEEANANLNRPPIAPMDTLNKEKALKSLLASVPLEDLRTARAEKQHVLRATRMLSRKVKADGKGGWKFPGMKVSLHNHQIQGAAWMKERETGGVEPLGGLQADGMGLGKTLMTIACMISNSSMGSTSRCTLIVCTPALITQWESEIRKHTESGVFPNVLKYHAREFSRIYGDAEDRVQKADVVITSYQEVLKSYPRFQPPKEMMLLKEKEAWWAQAYEKNRAILHRVHFHRIVLDEAQIIKNHLSQISVACRGLMGKHRWAISGTPIQNRIDEFFPFFKFLRVPHTGSFEVFKENFADPDNEDANQRLHSFLRQFMIRRTHQNTLFGRALIKMPKTTQRTIELEFNPVERAVYEAVRNRYINRINRSSREGVLEKSYGNVLTMLLRLQQLTAHPFMLQKIIEDLFQLEDVEKLWALTAAEVTADDNPARNMLTTMKKMIVEKENPVENDQPAILADDPPVESYINQPGTLVFKFRRFLRDLAQSQKWEDLKNRSLCHKCRDPPDEPWVTSCLHVYCKECLNALAYEAARRDQEKAACLDCGSIYSESNPCDGLKELQMDAEGSGIDSSEGSQTRTRKDPEQELKWIDFQGTVLPSTKTAAVQAQMELWLETEPDKKIIVFSQFHMLMKVLGRVFRERGWKFVNYHGKMTHEARDNAINSFRDDEDTKIMIASLKCGGVGLNLTMASRVICVDLWWNSSVEQQAFCRIYRIGQESETFITRLVVKNTVDEKLQAMQDSKEVAIGAAIDSSQMLDKLSLTDLMRLFGPVQTGEDRKPFIMVDDEHEFDSIIPPIL